ncbi:polysaccharide deacetylase family protein [Catenovulum sp. SM1970]|uniref:polysaccharide deacetylase family protein n=1 Tax=Marinifaba aquimaris TaxID=2741323 RepID=UPI001572A862|nr:polysaccharide deacetylase family protein [Marinifaba aquimaris]NTS77578.1 polysaccharide deacetylase family protein [Marinifaba aquimaris]
MIKKFIVYPLLVIALLFAITFGAGYTALYLEAKPKFYQLNDVSDVAPETPKQASQVYTQYRHLWLSEVFGFDQIPEDELARQANTYPGGMVIEGKNHEKKIALTFDDGPSQYSLAIVKQLEKYDIPATFFWTGSRVLQSPEIAKVIADKGYPIENHTWEHQRNGQRDAKEFWQNSVSVTNEAIKKVTGTTPSVFRPSYGDISDEQIEFLNEQGLTVVNWSIDSRDWNTRFIKQQDIVDIVNHHMHPGAIVLMHDDGGDRSNTVNALPAIIEHYHAHGYEFVTVEELLK